MAHAHWHKLYQSTISAPAPLLFRLLSDLPNYADWLPGSATYGRTTDVDPYPVRQGTRYRDGKPDEPGQHWTGRVTGFRPPGALDFHQVIPVRPLRATVDVHIHYSIEEAGDPAAGGRSEVTRWLVLDARLPLVTRPLWPLAVAAFNKENVRTMAALKQHAEAQSAAGPAGDAAR
jgi:Polyketide cyclase / dehydrase and lipid transport